MGKATFNSKRSGFHKKNSAFIDMVNGHMAMDIEIHLKTNAGMPVSNTKASGNVRGGGGHMKSETRHFRSANRLPGSFRVEVDKEYAAYQERGARKDGSHKVENYSTPGTSAGYFKRAIKMVITRRSSYVREAAKAVGL